GDGHGDGDTGAGWAAFAVSGWGIGIARARTGTRTRNYGHGDGDAVAGRCCVRGCRARTRAGIFGDTAAMTTDCRRCWARGSPSRQREPPTSREMIVIGDG